MKISRAEPLHRYHLHDTHLGLLDRLFFKREQERPNFNRRMFDEDFAGIFNYENRHSGRLFDIASNDEELTEQLFSNVHTRYGPHSVDETAREWIAEIAQSLVWFGTAYYYVNHDMKRDQIHITSFGPSGVMSLFGVHLQWMPKRTERHWDRDDEEVPRQIRVLDASKVMRFVLPKSVKRILNAQNRTLAVLDKHQFEVTEFRPQSTHENPNPTNHFDFAVWRDTQEFALYRCTRGTGWNGRKYDSSKRSDFFDCYRRIRFRRNQLILRDGIMSQLSAQLSKIGKGYNAEFKFEISSTHLLPSIKRLDELEAMLTREEVGFTEIIDYCFKR